jgi:hypothetical protein
MKRNSKWKAHRRARMPRTRHHPSEMIDANAAFGDGPPLFSLGIPSNILTDAERARLIDVFIAAAKQNGEKPTWRARVKSLIFMAVLKLKTLLWQKKKKWVDSFGKKG